VKYLKKCNQKINQKIKQNNRKGRKTNMKTFGEFINEKSIGASQAAQNEAAYKSDKAEKFLIGLDKLIDKMDDEMNIKWFSTLIAQSVMNNFGKDNVEPFILQFKKVVKINLEAAEKAGKE
jgi:hypothetical protein